MKIFLDTASVSEMQGRRGAWAWSTACTTNPSLIAKEKRPFRPLVEEICAVVPGDVSLEVVATDFEGMVKEGKELAQVAPNVVVKCPLTKDGLKAVKYLRQGHPGNQTLCFSATQALLSAKAGAVYISPFLGRLDDIGARRAWTWSATSARSTATTGSRRRCWRRRSATRSTSSTRRKAGAHV